MLTLVSFRPGCFQQIIPDKVLELPLRLHVTELARLQQTD